jgi:predicted enzyme related to lactoylglutathione lyase
MSEADRAGIQGLAGVLIWTDAQRFPEMRRFYRDVLGLVTRSDRPDFINFAWGDVRLSVSVHHEVAGRADDPLRVMVNFTVEDIHAAVVQLRTRGVAFSRPPEQEKWGGWVATFNDPDGNTLQLFQLPG